MLHRKTVFYHSDVLSICSKDFPVHRMEIYVVFAHFCTRACCNCSVMVVVVVVVVVVTVEVW